MKTNDDLRGILAGSRGLGAIATVAMLWLLFLPGADGLDPLGYHWGHDFVNYWSGGHLAASGRVGVLYDLDAYYAAVKETFSPKIVHMNFSYPPSVLPLLVPFGLLPYGLAFVAWSLAGALALAWTVSVGIGRRDGAAVAILLLSPILVFTLAFGQASTFFTAMLVGGLAVRPRRPVLAGILFGLATVKPQLGAILPFYLLWVRDWRTIATAILTATALVGVSVAVWGLAPWHDYVAATMPYQSDAIVNPRHYGSLAQLEFSPFLTLRCLELPVPVAAVVHGGLVALFVAGAIATARRAASPAVTIAMVAFLTVFVQPYSLAYDLIIPATALVILAASGVGCTVPTWGGLALRLFWLEPPLALLTWTAFPTLVVGVVCVLPAFAAVILGLWNSREPGTPAAAR